MGSERFDTRSYASYSDTNSLKSASRKEIFTSTQINQALDPKKIIMRESCDSAANPQSTPIILGLDVTGSMGFIVEQIAKEGLPVLMQRIYEEQPVSDPHLMFMGIGDVHCDRAPLQVSQFEAGAVVLIEQLRTMWLEGGGGGNDSESYDLPWYFAANKTSIDSFNKRGQKGFIFTIGDEMPPSKLNHHDIERVFGDGQHLDAGTTEELIKAASERYQIFHIIAEEGNYAQGRKAIVNSAWVKLLGPNVIRMKNHKNLAEIIVAILRIANGSDMNTIISESQIKSDLEHAFSNTANQ